MPAQAGSEPEQEAPPYLVPHNPSPVRVLYEDDALLLVHKPDLLLSVPGRHPLNRDCMISRLQESYPEARVVHRLDLDTSGIMVVALGKAAHSALSRLFQEREVRKTYRARVWGSVRENTGRIDLPIAPDWPRRPLQKICGSGKASLTHYQVLHRGDRWTDLELEPHTGRSHQLRIHCRELGHPILGCDMYSPPEVLGLAPRLMLHAETLSFPHPVTGRILKGHCPVPF
ncbi:MAG: pseudouridine synthase [Pseudomonadota bacterium]